MALIKSAYELEVIREGGAKLGRILNQITKAVKPGVSAAALDALAEALIRDAGGTPSFKDYRVMSGVDPFPGALCVSVNNEVVHGIPSEDKILQEGDIVGLDIGMQYPAPTARARGYFTDTAVTVPVGGISKAYHELITVTRRSLEAGIEVIRPGHTLADIAYAIQEVILPHGYSIVRDYVGHGVGHAVHEEPSVPNYLTKGLDAFVLKSGMVLALEPMVNAGKHEVRLLADGWTVVTRDKSRSAHFEHTVIVTERGHEVVTRTYRE